MIRSDTVTSFFISNCVLHSECVLSECVSLFSVFASPLMLPKRHENSLISLIIRLIELNTRHRAPLLPFPFIVFCSCLLLLCSSRSVSSSTVLIFSLSLCTLLSHPLHVFYLLLSLSLRLPADFCLRWSGSPSTD